MYHKILHEPLRFPKGERLQLSEPSKDLLRGMLERKVSDRLGCGAGAAGDIKRSAFFVSLDFNKVRGGAAGTSPDQPVAFSLFTLFSRLPLLLSRQVLAREYTPEFCPPAASSLTDVRNFDTEFTSEQAADSMVVSHMTATMQEKTRFDGFTYQDKRL
jgi:serum/glucocorticoid-regulated kinase 2